MISNLSKQSFQSSKKASTKKELMLKKVKMQSKCRPNRKDFRGYKEVPWLTISGVWLDELGFGIGSHVEIISSEHQLIIKKV